MSTEKPTDYMGRPEELAKHGELCRLKGEKDAGAGALPLFVAIAADDTELFDCLWNFWNFEHAWDDLLDETDISESEKETAMAALHDSVVGCLSGPFEQKYPLQSFLNVWAFLVKRSRWDADRVYLALRAREKFFATLRSNPFVRRHTGDFRALFVQCMLRCLDGDMMASSADPERRALAPAVRCGDVDAVFHMIYLARGWAAARTWSRLRDYDVREEGKGS